MGRLIAFSTDEVVRLYRTGKSLHDVAALVGASAEGVRTRLIAAGEPLRTRATAGVNFDWPDEAVADLRKMHADGLSSAAMSRAINHAYSTELTRNAVIGKLHRLGIIKTDVERKASLSAGGNMQKGRAPAFAKGFQRPKLKLVIGGNGTVIPCPEVSKPKLPPPREIDISVAAEPKPWLERRFGECAWPVDGIGAETLSCCNKALPTGYCKTHDDVRIGAMPKSWAGFTKPGFAKVMAR